VTLDGMNIQSVSGGGHHGGGIFINTFDQARFGLLIARNGKWKDRQLISSKWISMAKQPSLANKSYGFMWWTNEMNDLGNVSKNIFYANGFGGNFIVIDQEHDLVMVARWIEPSKLGEWVRLIEASLEK
jgi:CubicO group peptidase (beta-lactamase class C family)